MTASSENGSGQQTKRGGGRFVGRYIISHLTQQALTASLVCQQRDKVLNDQRKLLIQDIPRNTVRKREHRESHAHRLCVYLSKKKVRAGRKMQSSVFLWRHRVQMVMWRQDVMNFKEFSSCDLAAHAPTTQEHFCLWTNVPFSICLQQACFPSSEQWLMSVDLQIIISPSFLIKHPPSIGFVLCLLLAVFSPARARITRSTGNNHAKVH